MEGGPWLRVDLAEDSPQFESVALVHLQLYMGEG